MLSSLSSAIDVEWATVLTVIATDYYGQCECVCESGPLFPAIAASAALPAVFRPAMINGRVMIDGMMMYRDTHHLSYRGDLFMGELFAKQQAALKAGHAPAPVAGQP